MNIFREAKVIGKQNTLQEKQKLETYYSNLFASDFSFISKHELIIHIRRFLISILFIILIFIIVVAIIIFYNYCFKLQPNFIVT